MFLKHVRTDRCSPFVQVNDDDDRDGSGDGSMLLALIRSFAASQIIVHVANMRSARAVAHSYQP